MRTLRFTLLMSLALLFVLPSAEAVVTARTMTTTTATTAPAPLSKKELRQQKRAERKELKQELKETIREWKRSGADTNTLLLVIIAILLPPLAMAIYEGGITNRFWISLLLTLLFYVPGLIYTLVVILGGR